MVADVSAAQTRVLADAGDTLRQGNAIILSKAHVNAL